MTTSSLRTDIARAIGARLRRIMVPSQRAWAEDMKAEIEAIEDPGAALSFALGCLGAGCLRRARTLSGALMIARTSVGIIAGAFSAVVLTTAWAFAQIDSPAALPLFTAFISLAFLIAGLAMLRKGPATLTAVAATMLVLNTLGFWANNQIQPLHAEVQRALIMEGYLLWTALLLAGVTLHLCGRSERLAILAQRLGWGD